MGETGTAAESVIERWQRPRMGWYVRKDKISPVQVFGATQPLSAAGRCPGSFSVRSDSLDHGDFSGGGGL